MLLADERSACMKKLSWPECFITAFDRAAKEIELYLRSDNGWLVAAHNDWFAKLSAAKCRKRCGRRDLRRDYIYRRS
jgi:hypothetical protein